MIFSLGDTAVALGQCAKSRVLCDQTGRGPSAVPGRRRCDVPSETTQYAHAHIYIYIYIQSYIKMCVCIHVRVCTTILTIITVIVNKMLSLVSLFSSLLLLCLTIVIIVIVIVLSRIANYNLQSSLIGPLYLETGLGVCCSTAIQRLNRRYDYQ